MYAPHGTAPRSADHAVNLGVSRGCFQGIRSRYRANNEVLTTRFVGLSARYCNIEPQVPCPAPSIHQLIPRSVIYFVLQSNHSRSGVRCVRCVRCRTDYARSARGGKSSPSADRFHRQNDLAAHRSKQADVLRTDRSGLRHVPPDQNASDR
jgi:hypothetical protein